MASVPDDEDRRQFEAARADVAAAVQARVTSGMVERAVFRAAGHESVGARAWQASRDAAEAGRREAGRLLRERFGARNPRRGWIGLLLIAGAFCAIAATVLSLGLRADPVSAGPLAGVFGALAGAVCVAAVAGSRLRPLNRAALRPWGFIAIALIVAAGASLTRSVTAWAISLAVCAAIAVVSFVVILIVRGRDADATRRVDTAIETAYLDAAPVVADGARAAQADAIAALPAGDAARIVRVRDAVLAELAESGTHLPGTSPGAPVGTMIIAELTTTWLPADIDPSDPFPRNPAA